MTTEPRNMELTQGLDDAWNAQEVDFCTVARWDHGAIVEEDLCSGVVGLMSQIGIGIAQRVGEG